MVLSCKTQEGSSIFRAEGRLPYTLPPKFATAFSENIGRVSVWAVLCIFPLCS